MTKGLQAGSVSFIPATLSPDPHDGRGGEVEPNWVEEMEALKRARGEWVLAQFLGGWSFNEISATQGMKSNAVRHWLTAYDDLWEQYRDAVQEERVLREQRRAEARWNGAIAARAKPRRHPIKWTDERLEQFVRDAADELGQPLSSLAFKNWLAARDAPTYRGLAIRLGKTWGEVCERCGVTAVGGRGIGRTVEECEKAVARVTELLGRPPTNDEYAQFKTPDDPSPATVRVRLAMDGKWSSITSMFMEKVG